MNTLGLCFALLTFIQISTGEAKPSENTEDFGKIIHTLQTRMATIESREKQTQVELVKTKERIADLEAELQQNKDRKMDADSMFLATISLGSVSIASGGPIIWDEAAINPGSHFSTVTGGYTAPVNGYYQFSVTKFGNNNQGSFYFLVDEERYAYKPLFTGSDETTASSATINIELTAGQVVKVENTGSTLIYGINAGAMYSWFTGGLLYAE